MANYSVCVASNEFVTKNNEEVAQVFLDFGFEETYVTSHDKVFVGGYDAFIGWEYRKVYRKKDTKEVVLAYDESSWELSDLLVENNMTCDDLDDTEEIGLVEYLQEMLLDDSYMSIKEVGNEKLRCVDGCACLITKTKEVWFNLNSCIEEELKSQGIENKYL